MRQAASPAYSSVTATPTTIVLSFDRRQVANKRRLSVWHTKLAWIQNPRVFRLLLSLNERLSYRMRFIANPTVHLR
jgi:hypothetical protein